MDMKPGPSYKMSKANKIMLSQIACPHERGVHRRLIIQADLKADMKPAKILDKTQKPIPEEASE